MAEKRERRTFSRTIRPVTCLVLYLCAVKTIKSEFINGAVFSVDRHLKLSFLIMLIGLIIFGFMDHLAI